MANMSRRFFVGVAGTAALAAMGAGSLAGCAGASDAASPSQGNAGATEQAESTFKNEGKSQHLVCAVTGKLIKIAPSIIAQKLNYFEEEGCDVEFQQIALADAMASMSISRLDIDLFGVVPACTYVSQGSGVYVFGGTILDGSEMLAASSFDKKLDSAESFRGLSVACQREETGQMYLKSYLKEKGLELGKDVEFVYVDNPTSALEGLRSGQNDLFITNNAMGYSLAGNGIKVAGVVCDLTGDYPCCRQNCSTEAYEKKYLSLVDFEIALLRGYDYYKNNKDTVIPMLAEYSSQEVDYVEAAMYGTPEYRNVMNLAPDPYRNAVIDFYGALKNIGEIDADTPYTIDEYVVPDIYKKALDTLAEREPDNKTYKELLADYDTNNL